ncbi:MAG: hypothetical protein OXN16_10865 [Gammaproteobacteria bacterium]|nr:hypothetical protein [Gammaproteobacteria bacterium]
MTLALVYLFDQAKPEGRTMEDFQRHFDSYLDEILNHPSANSEDVRGVTRSLRDMLYDKTEMIPLHRMNDGDVHH